MSEDDDGFEFEEYDASPHDAAFESLRKGIAFVNEYQSVAVPDTRLAWAIADMRGDIMDLVQALLDNDNRRIVKGTRDVIKLVKDILGDI